MMNRKAYRHYAPAVIGTLLVTTVITASAMLIRNWVLSAPPPQRQIVQQITLIPPPPMPAPKLQQPPPETVQKEVDINQPKAQVDKPNDEPPPGKLLGLDADGSAGSDGFGLAAHKGGRGLIGDGSGSRFGWYANALQRDIQDALSEDTKIRTRNYSVVVRLWMKPDGGVQRVELVGSTGVPAVDHAIVQRLSSMAAMAQVPPQDMPQPVKLRISSRL